MHEYWLETPRAGSDIINYVVLLRSVCSLLFSIDIPPSSSTLTLQSNSIHLDWEMQSLQSLSRLQMHEASRTWRKYTVHIKTTIVTGLLSVLQTVDFNLIAILQVCLRNWGIRVHTLAINHQSWSPFLTDASVVEVLIRYTGTFQECLNNGATGCRRSHVEGNVLCNTRPYDQLEYVAIVIICH